MATALRAGWLRGLWQAVLGPRDEEREQVVWLPSHPVAQVDLADFDIAPNDPLMAYFTGAAAPVEIDKLNLDSPALRALRAAGVKLVVPLVSQGELIGLLNLGPRLSEQEYSTDDRKLLENLAAQAAPAVRVAQLVREQEAEARQRERIAQELEVARLIQQNYLPKSLPELDGWRLAACYRPAREVGGDFYDFIELPDDHLGIVIGDVSGKGVPAALVMAATRSVLRASAQRLLAPGEVLEGVNEIMCPDTPPNMFVTCFYAVLEAGTGRLRYANAGQSLPYLRTGDGVVELKARGMPLGLLPGMPYEEKEVTLEAGAMVLFHSDGLAEAHNDRREMFGFPKVKELMAVHPGGGEARALVECLLGELDHFTAGEKEQDDDVTLVTLERSAVSGQGSAVRGRGSTGEEAGGRMQDEERGDDSAVLRPSTSSGGAQDERGGRRSAVGGERVLAEFSLPSAPGNERQVMERVAEAVASLQLPERTLKRLKTAVAEATMNAIEHGNQNRAELPVDIRVLVSGDRLTVRIIDQGGHRPIPEVGTPDLDAKLAGLDRPRGWGLFLIKNMVDEMEVGGDETHRVVSLTLRLEGGSDGG